MTRKSTEVRDRKIHFLDKRGIDPKMIAVMLRLWSVQIVYDARRRLKNKGTIDEQN